MNTWIIFLSLVGVAASQAGPSLELIADPSFCTGFAAKDRDGKERIVRWDGEAARKPAWNVAQHHSKSSLADTNRIVFHEGGLTFRDDFETIVAHPQDLAADLILGVNAFREYDGQYRAKGAPWPHLYVEQRISNPHGHLGESSTRLTDLERVDLSVSVRLLQDQDHKTPQYSRQLHATQFLLFFTIQNLNRQSPGYGDYYWFGIALYDSREQVTTLHAMQDKGSPEKKGTEKFIYDIGIAPFTSQVVAEGHWVTVRGDLLPHLQAGLREAWKRGFLPASSNPADYRIGGLVMGWEVTGLNDVRLAVKDLKAVAVRRFD